MEEKQQIAIKITEWYVSRLDDLAKLGGINRNHLMLSLINLWLHVLDSKGILRHLFYISNLLRVREIQWSGGNAFEHEFTELRIPEKPLPLKFSEADLFNIQAVANLNHISRHLLLKTMIIVGVEELEDLTDRSPYEWSAVETKLTKSLLTIMKKGYRALEAYRK